jgi:transposase
LGDEVALKVERVMDGSVHIEKALGRASRLEPLHFDGVDGPRSRHQSANGGRVSATLRRPSMKELTTVGLDIGKRVLHAHGADRSGAALWQRKLRREEVLAFFAGLPRYLIGMEARADGPLLGPRDQRPGT